MHFGTLLCRHHFLLWQWFEEVTVGPDLNVYGAMSVFLFVPELSLVFLHFFLLLLLLISLGVVLVKVSKQLVKLTLHLVNLDRVHLIFLIFALFF